MQCEGCGKLLALGRESVYNSRFLCESCFLEALAPSGTCDLAMPRRGLTSLQLRILRALRGTDGVAIDALAAGLEVAPPDLERELLSLVRIEKVRDARKGGKKVFQVC